ncbi:MAG: hypothetical protein GY928_03935, partial [Colwellia sp.]|nr:hypothetical protein [Colwellia sp.]
MPLQNQSMLVVNRTNPLRNSNSNNAEQYRSQSAEREANRKRHRAEFNDNADQDQDEDMAEEKAEQEVKVQFDFAVAMDDLRKWQSEVNTGLQTYKNRAANPDFDFNSWNH